MSVPPEQTARENRHEKQNRSKEREKEKGKKESGSIVVQPLFFKKKIYTKLLLTIRIYQANSLVSNGGPNGHFCLDAFTIASMTSQENLLFIDWCGWTCGFWLPFAIHHHLGYNANKESDDGSDDSAPTRCKSQPLGRRSKDYRHPTHRWSQFKISFDSDSVRLESEMHPLQSTGGGGAGERPGGSLSTGPSGALMTASSSISAAGGIMAQSAPSTVAPTIKIIGKEVSRTRRTRMDLGCNQSGTKRAFLASVSRLRRQEKKHSSFF